MLLAACSRLPPGPELTGVEPAEAYVDEAIAVTVSGSNLLPRTKVDLDEPHRSPPPDSTFRLALVRDGARSDLAEVMLSELGSAVTGRLVPPLQVGTWSVELLDPYGRTATLVDAFRVKARCDVDADCQATCRLGRCVSAVCRYELAPDGLACDGGSCLSGECSGPPCSCSAAEPCRLARCLPDGGCETIAGPDGAKCDDGEACTFDDRCAAGACTGTAYYCTGGPCMLGVCLGDGGCALEPDIGRSCDDQDLCTARDVCVADGGCRGERYACDGGPCGRSACAGDGTCTFTPDPAANGRACDDGVLCTHSDRCSNGSCSGTGYTCVGATGGCGVEPRCDGDGGCPLRAAVDGERCNDGVICTHLETCQAGACRAGVDFCGNTAPRACFSVSPTAGPAGSSFTYDATCSVDAEDGTGLRYRWDYERTGQLTPWTTAKVTTHVHRSPGLYTAVLEVRDDGGISAFAERFVAAYVPADDVVVTTLADEDDPLATPSRPGGTGLSLREAIRYANRFDGGVVIRFDGGMRLKAGVLPALMNARASIVGHGTSVDFRGAAGDCLELDQGASAFGLELFGCAGTVVVLGAGAQLAEARLHPGTAGGAGPKLVGPGAVLGPRNEVFGFDGMGVSVRGTPSRIVGNAIHHNKRGIDIGPVLDGVVVEQNDIYANDSFGVMVGRSGNVVRFNTFHANGGAGVNGGPLTQNTEVRNNLFTAHGGTAVDLPEGDLGVREPNGFFGNAADFLPGVDGGSSNVLADPRYVNPDAGDFRLMPKSPAVNAGIDVGIDVNGASPGRYDFGSPDLGAHESPYPDAG